MGKLLCEKNLRDVWCRNESVRAEIGQILHTDASPLVVVILYSMFLYAKVFLLPLYNFFNLSTTN